MQTFTPGDGREEMKELTSVQLTDLSNSASVRQRWRKVDGVVQYSFAIDDGAYSEWEDTGMREMPFLQPEPYWHGNIKP